MKKFLKNVQESFLNHRHKVQPAITFVGKCVEDVTKLPETPSVMNFVDLGFKVKNNYFNSFKLNKTDYFLNNNWEEFLCTEIWPVIVGILQISFKNHITVITNNEKGSPDTFVTKVADKINIGWKGAGTYIEKMYVSSGMEKEAKEIISDVVWKKLKMKCLAIDVVKKSYWEHGFLLSSQKNHESFITSEVTEKYTQETNKYLKKGVGRSLLFYGPPGTGKSNIVRAVANSLNLQTVRIQNLSSIRSAAIVDTIELFGPDAIVLEDIDHLYASDISSLLEKIESFNQLGKYIFATANEISKIDAALIRPGRFDELIEITVMSEQSVRKLIQDEELFQRVKSFPIAYISEVKKRLDTIGLAATIEGLGDLEKRVTRAQKPEYKL